MSIALKKNLKKLKFMDGVYHTNSYAVCSGLPLETAYYRSIR